MKTYPTHSFIHCIEDYKEPEGEWLPCPNCGLKPKVWQFDNGRHTACGCWESKYDHFSINAESINSIYNRTNSTKDYDVDGLRNNWNEWCKTKTILFVRNSLTW